MNLTNPNAASPHQRAQNTHESNLSTATEPIENCPAVEPAEPSEICESVETAETPDSAPAGPPEPGTLEEAGLPETLVEQLVLKILYFRGELYGQDLSAAIALRFSVIQGIVSTLKLRRLIQVKHSLGMGDVTSVFALTEHGRNLTREYLESNQ